MSYLLDTNIVSEPRKPRPSPAVLAWLIAAPPNLLFISAITIGEIRAGIERLRDENPRRCGALEIWLSDLVDGLDDRLVPLDSSICERWGRLHHALRGAPVSTTDELIAATALVHDWTVVTRNTSHFERTGVRVLNPFDA